jgi:MinD superfamily P-loop ATPase
MKELVIISGKGGTGKTTLTASFAYLARNRILADCDVDAADLHILVQPEILHKEEFLGGFKAGIDTQTCSQCGICRESCRYGAISGDFVVNDFSCEGCGVCLHVCPEQAISMEQSLSGSWFISETRMGPMVHAALRPGEENSGKLVALVRNQAKVMAKKKAMDLILVDGAPGVGCPVISSITGADHALVVTEPTLSGLHDMRRALELIRRFRIGASVVVNKADVNLDVAAQIEDVAAESGASVLGRIPYDSTVIRAMVQRRCPVEEPNCAANESIRSIWERLRASISS